MILKGLIMMAACQNAPTYAAAYVRKPTSHYALPISSTNTYIKVFYWVGFDGISYVLNVFVADTTSLKNRAFITAITTTPYIVTTFIGPPAAQSFIDTSGWRWGYGSFTIITPFIVIPIMYIIWKNQHEALNAGLISKRAASGRSVLQSIEYYFWEFDGRSRLNKQDAKLTILSVRSTPHRRRDVVDPVALFSRGLSVQRLGIRHDHCDACHWHPVPHRFPHLGEVLLQEMFPPIRAHGRPNNNGCLSPGRLS